MAAIPKEEEQEEEEEGGGGVGVGCEVSDYDENGLAEKYIELKDVNPYFAGDRRVLRSLIKQVEEEIRIVHNAVVVPPIRDICDLACGNGYYARLFMRDAISSGSIADDDGNNNKTKLRIVGIDLSEDMIKDAQAQDEKDQLGIKYVQGDVNSDDTIRKANGPFDLCTASYLINYFTKYNELVQVLCSVRKLLRPGGHFIGLTVNPNFNLNEPEEFLQRFGCWFEPPHTTKDNNKDRYPNDGDIVRVYLSMCNKEKPNDKIYLDIAYWSMDTYERAFIDSGMKIMKWQLPERDPYDPIDGTGTTEL